MKSTEIFSFGNRGARRCLAAVSAISIVLVSIGVHTDVAWLWAWMGPAGIFIIGTIARWREPLSPKENPYSLIEGTFLWASVILIAAWFVAAFLLVIIANPT